MDSRKKTNSRSLTWLALLLLATVSSRRVEGQAASGYSEYYIPAFEDNLQFILNDLDAGGGTLMHSVVSITAWSGETKLYWDHWENGYNFDPNNPSTADETYTLATAGANQIFDEGNIPTPRVATSFFHDGRDRLYVAGGPVTVTRAAGLETRWAGNQAVAWEIYPVSPQLTTYVLPFGENQYVANNNYFYGFERVYALVQATADNTTVQVDLDGNGTFDPLNLNRDATKGNAGDGSSVTLNRGDTFLLDRIVACTAGPNCTTNPGTLNAGTVIQGSSTLQVKYVTGHAAVTYCARGLSAFPRGLWTKDYYAPFDQSSVNPTTRITDYYLYNPQATALTINWESLNATGSFSVNPGTTASFRQAAGVAVPTGSGLYFKANAPFWGVGFGDSRSGGLGTGQGYEWGFSLLPSTLLYKEHFLGWAPGSLPVGSAPTNGNGVFLSVAQDNTQVFVDYNGGGADVAYTLNRLQTQFIADPDGDLSNAHIWATGPFTMAYGENGNFATTPTPNLDLGYVAIPGADFISLVLDVKKAVNPVVVPTTGGPSTFTLTISSKDYTVDGVTVVDDLAPNWTFSNNSAVITRPDLSPLSGAAANPTISGTGPYTLTWSSAQVCTPAPLPCMAENQSIVITYTAQAGAMASGTLSRNDVRARGSRSVGGITQVFNAVDFAYNVTGATRLAKVSLAADPVSPGDTIPYQVTVTNPAAGPTLTGVTLYDPLPVGVSAVAGSTSLSRSTVADRFGSQSYSLNAGTRNWAGNWIEANDGANVATGGDIQVNLGGELVLDNSASNEPTISRAVDTSGVGGAGANRVILAFKYRTDTGVDAADQVLVQAGTTGTGGAFTTVDTITGITGVSSGARVVDLSAYIGANTAIRFTFPNGSYQEAAEFFYVDDLSITYEVGVSNVATADPPELASLYSLAAGQNLVATFNVKVDSPFPTGQTTINNTASVSSTQLPIAITASASNVVLVPTVASASAGDRIWLDVDGDGVQDVGEPGLANVTVTLTDRFGTPVATTVTDSTGYYSFTGVAPGTGYYVQVTGGLPAGLTQSSQGRTDNRTNAFDLLGGQVYTLADLGYRTPPGTAAFGDQVWIDADADGIEDPGEVGLGGVTLRLYRDADGNGLLNPLVDTLVARPTTGLGAVTTNGTTTVTGVGTTFTTLAPGDPITISGNTYTISTITSDTVLTLTASAPAATAVGFVVTSTQGPGTVTTTTAAGTTTVTGTGTSFLSLAPGDPIDIAGVKYKVASVASNTILTLVTVAPNLSNRSYGIPSPTKSAPDGSYLITGAPATGSPTYFVSATTPSGYLSTTGTVSRFQGVAAGSTLLTADFGFRDTGTTYTIRDRVWVDTNANQVFDAGESGIGGVTVDLLDASLRVVGTVTTASDGTFSFSGLAGGGADYTVRLTDTSSVLADYTATTTWATARERAEANLTGNVDRVASPPPSYGFRATRAIGDSVYRDLNASGTQDPGEPGMASVVVSLYKDVGGDGSLSLTAAANVNVTNGSATVTGTGFLNYHAGEPVMVAGALYTIQSVVNNTTLTLTTSYTGAGGSQSFRAPSPGPGTVGVTNGSAAVTGSGFLNYRAGEPITINNGGAANVVYTILSVNSDTSLTLTTTYTGTTNAARTYYGPGDALVGSVTTDAGGQYLFAGLPDRRYIVSVPDQPGYTHVPGTRPDTDATVPGIQLGANVTGGVNVLDRDFGFQASSAGGIQGTVWNDADGNGTIGGTETGRFAGVTVEVLSGSTVVATLTTDATGSYSVAGLPVGPYTVRVTDVGGVLTGKTATTSTSTSVNVTANTTATVNFGFRTPTPTYAAVSSFQASLSDGKVIVEWRTTQEVGTVGFHLLRFDRTAGGWVQVDESLLPGLLGHPEGGTYTFRDTEAPVASPLAYKLVEVDAWGSQREYGPWKFRTLQPGAPVLEPYQRTPAAMSSADVSRSAMLRAELAEAALAQSRQKASRVKIVTKAAGLHYIDTATLAGLLGEKPNSLASRVGSGRVVLENLGSVVPYSPATGGTGLYFYAERIDSPYTDENVYWISAQKGPMMATSAAQPTGRAPEPTFPETVHSEADQYPLPALFQDPNADFYCWDYLFAGSPSLGTRTFTAELPGVAGSGDPTLVVRLQGASDTDAPLDHHVRITWNGRAVGDATWDGVVPHEVSFPLLPSDLVEGQNALVLTALLDSGVAYGVVYLDSFDVSYRRLYRAVGNELSFTVPAEAEVAVSGFTSPGAVLLDVTTPENPLLVTGATAYAPGDGTYGLRFANRGATTRSYLAAVPANAKRPVSMTPNEPSGLSASTNAADYLVIVPSSLVPAAETLAAYRRTQGLDTMVVDLEDVHDEFGYGLATPVAVQDFLARATASWSRPPQYVTLVGRGTFDYKNVQGVGDNIMPTLLAGTPYGLAASDVSFAPLSTGAGRGLKAIGRLPVLTSQELLDYVAKVQTHESAAAAAWQKNLLLAADNPDAGGAFTDDSDAVGSLAPVTFLKSKVYLTTYSAPDARTAIRNTVSSGALLFNYIGHGGPDRLADENIFDKADVPFLTNAGRLPVFLAMTCSTGNFAIPGFPSLGEALVLWKGGGAYATWAPSGLSLNDGARALNEAFFRGAFVDGEKVVGRNCTKALEGLPATGPTAYMKAIYNVIGEPVVRLP